MDSQQILYFLKVAETEHMTNAAKELYISQPALSRSLRGLEEELGVKLFDRTGRRLVLNDNGRQFYAFAAQFRQGVEGLRQRSQTHPAVAGALTVDLRVENTLVLDAVADFCRYYPGVRVQAAASSGAEPLHQQWDFQVDAHNPLFSPEGPGGMGLFEEPYLLALSEALPLAQGESVSFAQARELPFVLPLPDQELSQIIRAYCREAGFRPICQLETNSYPLAFSMVEQGNCAALVPKYAPGVEERPHIRLLPLREKAFCRTIFLVRSPGLVLDEAAERFERFLVERLRSPLANG